MILQALHVRHVLHAQLERAPYGGACTLPKHEVISMVSRTCCVAWNRIMAHGTVHVSFTSTATLGSAQTKLALMTGKLFHES